MSFNARWISGMLVVACLGWVPVSPAIADATATKTQQVDHVKDRALDVRNEAGDVEVVRAGEENAKVRVKATIKAENKERAGKTKLSAEREADGTLVVEIHWPDGERKAFESASIKVEVPQTSALRVNTGNGSVNLSNTSGETLLSVNNGSINVRGHEGPISFEVTNGKTEMRDVRGSVEGRAINGGATLTGVSGEVTVECTNGPIDIRLTADNKGPVKAKTSNAGVSLAVGKVFAGELRASTANGEVRIELPGLIKSMKEDHRARVVELMTDGDQSELTASNGDVKVKLIEDAPASSEKPSEKSEPAKK